MKPMTYREVARCLMDNGFVVDHVTGSHYIFYNQETGVSIPVPRHGNRTMKQGTLNGIFTQAGIPKPRR